MFLLSEKTLKFDNVRVDKKEFHKSKQPISNNLDLVNYDQIVVLTNLSIMMIVINILLVTKKTELLNRYALSYLKWLDTWNI